MEDYKLHNPLFQLIKVIEGNYENYLHKEYSHKRYIGEWFKLSEEDIRYICHKPMPTIMELARNRNRTGNEETLLRILKNTKTREMGQYSKTVRAASRKEKQKIAEEENIRKLVETKEERASDATK